MLGAIVFNLDWDWRRAEAAFRRATELNPASSDVYVEYAMYFALMGRVEEAHAAGLKAKQLDPLSTYAAHMLAVIRLARKDYDGAISEFQSAINLNPSWTWGYIKMGVAYAHKGMFREALMAAETAENRLRQGDTPMARAWLGYVYAASGQKERARDALLRFRRSTKTLREGASNEAIIHAGLRDRQRVLEVLEQGLEQRSVDMVYIKALPSLFWSALESEPRFQQVVQRMGLPVGVQKPGAVAAR